MHASWQFLIENFEDSAPDLSYGNVVAVPPRDSVIAYIKQAGRDDVVEKFRSSVLAQRLHARKTPSVPKMIRLSALDLADAAITNLSGLEEMFCEPNDKVTKRMYLKSRNTRTSFEAILGIWDDGSQNPTQMVRRAYAGARYYRPGVSGNGRLQALETFAAIGVDYRSMTDAVLSFDFGVSAFGAHTARPALVVANICDSASRSLTATERAQWMLTYTHIETSPKVETEYLYSSISSAVEAGISPVDFIKAFKNNTPLHMIVPTLTHGIDYDLVKEMVGA